MRNKIIALLVIVFLVTTTVNADTASKKKFSDKKILDSKKLSEIIVSSEPAEGNQKLYFYNFVASNIPSDIKIKSILLELSPPKPFK